MMSSAGSFGVHFFHIFFLFLYFAGGNWNVVPHMGLIEIKQAKYDIECANHTIYQTTFKLICYENIPCNRTFQSICQRCINTHMHVRTVIHHMHTSIDRWRYLHMVDHNKWLYTIAAPNGSKHISYIRPDQEHTVNHVERNFPENLHIPPLHRLKWNI